METVKHLVRSNELPAPIQEHPPEWRGKSEIVQLSVALSRIPDERAQRAAILIDAIASSADHVARPLGLEPAEIVSLAAERLRRAERVE